MDISNIADVLKANDFKNISEDKLLNTKLNKLKSEADNGVSFKNVLSDKVKANKPDPKLMEVCKQFESIFMNMVTKSMRETLNKEDNLLYGGMAEDIFNDMLYEKYSSLTTKNTDFGIAKQMYNQLANKSHIIKPNSEINTLM